MQVPTAARSAHVDTFTRNALPPRPTWPDLQLDHPDVQYGTHVNCAAELLDATALRMGADRPCLIDGSGATWSYGHVLRTTNQLARVLVEDLDLLPGQRVLLRGPNSPMLVACWLAVVKAGGVVVTTMPQLRRLELQTIGAMSKPQLALCDSRFLDELVDAEIPDLRIVPYGSPAADDLLHRARSKRETFDNVVTAADDVCLLAFTSGTTGKPKATMHFHRDVLAIADTFSRHVVKPLPSDVFAGSPPLAFTYGLGGLLVFPLRVGAATVLLEKATPDELFRAVAQHRVTVLFTAPTAYRAVLRQSEELDLRSLRRCISAGEALPASTWHAFRDRTGIRIIDGIGATEMLHVFIASSDDDIRPGSTGKAVPGYTACVLDPEGKPVPDGQSGLLAVKGPTGCRYLADERQTTYVQGGWNITGDIFTRDADGYFWYQTRADDMIVSSGYNIAAPEVEQALLAHSDVAECAVVGTPDDERGMIVTAFVVLVDPAAAGDETAHRLQDFVKQQIAPYKYPRVVHFVDGLPKTAAGKLQRFSLRQQAAQ